jgi:hypothetical protein
MIIQVSLRSPSRVPYRTELLPVCVECLIGKQKMCVFITAGPMIKLCAGGEGDSEGHVL